MKPTSIALCILLFSGCSDDADKKNATNLGTNNVDNNSTNSGTNNGTTQHNQTNGSNNLLNAAQECAGAGDCELGACEQIADAAAFCTLSPDLRVEECQTPDETNECCDDSHCNEGGRCVSSLVGHCGGFPPQALNLCLYDECQATEDCPENQACAPAGTFGRPVNTCIPALCKHDDECLESQGGLCALVHTSDTCPEPMLGCTYDGDDCRAAYQCDNGQVCVNGSCVMELATP